jgi:hypothetical protein
MGVGGFVALDPVRPVGGSVALDSACSDGPFVAPDRPGSDAPLAFALAASLSGSVTSLVGSPAAAFARGKPTSAPSGGGSGARSNPGSRRTAIRATRTIAAARTTPRHLIRTPAIPRQGMGRHVFSPAPVGALAPIRA